MSEMKKQNKIIFVENKHQDKIDLMRRLIDVYQQVENVRPESSKLIVEDHMHKLEKELVAEIRGVKDEKWKD